MKRTNTYISAALALLLGLAACNKTELENTDLNNGQTEDVAGTPIVFTATGLSSNTATTATTGTRATVDGDWYGVDSVAVMIGDTVKKYSVTPNALDTTRATLSSTDPYYWSTNYDTLTVTAWWPYTDGETSMPDVVVKENQSSKENFAASDFISTVEQKVTYSTSTLSFTHRTARVTIKLTDYTTGLTSIKLTNLSNENDNPQEITPYQYDDITYVALVAPQTVTEGTVFITYEFDGGKIFTYKKQNAEAWEAGKEYTYTVSLRAADPVGYTYDKNTKTYTVHNANGLLAWNKAVQDSLWLNCTLAADIDLTGVPYTWNLVGNYDYDNPYTGTFEGGYHTITGLTVNYSSSSCVGLIGYLGSGGRVQNLTLDNVSITGLYYVGGVVGQNQGSVTNCNSTGSVSGNARASLPYTYVGGVVGVNDGGSVTNCTASCSISSSGSLVGGVMGENNGIVTNCTASGSVSSTYSGDSYVGGIVGYNYATVTGCSASGDVTSSGRYVGGVVGRNLDSVTNCSSTGNVSSTYSGNSFVGGVVGYNYGTSSTVTGCTASGDVTSSGTNVGGVVGYNYYGTVTNCSASSKVSSTYSNDDADAYVGGVVGYNYGSSSTVTGCTASGDVSGNRTSVGGVVGTNEGTVTNSSASGSVTSSSTRVGGVVGNNQGTMIACSASGNVSSSGGSYVGGVAGWINGTAVACYATGTVTGSSSSNQVGGVVGFNYQGSTVTACYHATGNISGGNNDVGGVVGNNNGGTVTYCYWDNNMGSGVGRTENGGTNETTQVDGSSTTWQTAVTAMNNAISTWNSSNSNQCKWQYSTADASTPPILTEVEE